MQRKLHLKYIVNMIVKNVCVLFEIVLVYVLILFFHFFMYLECDFEITAHYSMGNKS